MTKSSQRSTPTKQQLNDRANALNNNRGTKGINSTNAKSHGNRSKQMNPNQR
jgi:hypothetical protein